MAPHAKYVAVFDTPFWREAGLSGAGRSGRGPMTEIHDASLPGQAAALFGFLGVPPDVRKSAGDAATICASDAPWRSSIAMKRPSLPI